MAMWSVSRSGEGLKVTYRNRGTGETHLCGVVRLDCPTDLLVAWICSQESLTSWDWLVLADGRVLQVLPPHPLRC